MIELKALLIGDLHIDNVKTSITNSDSFHEIFNLFDLIRNIIDEEKPDFVIFFGDVFNSPNKISSSVISIVSKLIADISVDTTTLFIVGNHDDFDNKVSEVKVGDRNIKVRSSLLSPFAFYPNVIVFDSPKVVKIQDGVEVAFIPYSTDIYESLAEADKHFSAGTKRILMGHFDMYQVFYRHKQAGNEDRKHPSAEELIRKYNYDLVLLGHIHDPAEYEVDGKYAKYIGSCRNVDFRNLGEEKGIYIFDFDTFDMKFINNPYTYVYKIFDNLDDLANYCKNNEPYKLSKTKVLYKYSGETDMHKALQFKDKLKLIKFAKRMDNLDNNNLTNVNNNILQEFEQLITNNLITHEKLVDYAIQFKEPPCKETALKIIDYINRI